MKIITLSPANSLGVGGLGATTVISAKSGGGAGKELFCDRAVQGLKTHTDAAAIEIASSFLDR
jgi:hypothetical protein